MNQASETVSESVVEQIRERLKRPTSDPLVAQQWIVQAKADLLLLIEDATDRWSRSGGEFAQRLREALESKILATVNGRVELTAAVSEHSLTVHVLPDQVVVDVRLKLGVQQG